MKYLKPYLTFEWADINKKKVNIKDNQQNIIGNLIYRNVGEYQSYCLYLFKKSYLSQSYLKEVLDMIRFLNLNNNSEWFICYDCLKRINRSKGYLGELCSCNKIQDKKQEVCGG